MISPEFAGFLRERRSSCNAQVSAARTRNPGFDTKGLNAFLSDTLDPLFRAVLAEDPDHARTFADAAFDMAVTLVEHRRAGNGSGALIIPALWQRVAPRLARIIAADAKESLGALTNAAIKIARDTEVRSEEWLRLVENIGPAADGPAQLRRVAIIAAWRAGVAHGRTAALDAADALPPELARLSVGGRADQEWPALAERLRRDRWWAPAGAGGRPEQTAGSFAGFGGKFVEPPSIAADGDDFLVRSGGLYFRLIADAFGATVRASEYRAVDSSSGAAKSRLRGSRLVADDRDIDLDGPVDGLQVAETADSLAVASPFSHVIRVYPRVLP